MVKYICFLRGVNVGGSKVIKMELLKKIFESFKFKNVFTFIQSGNIIFETPGKDIKKITSVIEAGLMKALSFPVEAFLRGKDELISIIKENPFKSVTTDKFVKIYISFLNEIPAEDKIKSLESLSYDAEIFKVKKKEVYVLVYKQKITGNAVYSNNFMERKLAVKGTSRDWNTINKIINLC